MRASDPWQPILRIILDDLAPQVRRVPTGDLEQILHPTLFPQGRGVDSSLDQEKTRDEREFYILAGIMTLVSEVLLPARLGGREGDAGKKLGLNTAHLTESLFQKISWLHESTFREMDLLGRVLQSVLDPVTRKHLAAFYTKPIVAKFISLLLITNGKGRFIDPACGTGAFLTAAFRRFEALDDTLHPIAILARLRGNEFSAIARLCAEANLKLTAGLLSEIPVVISQRDAFHLDIAPSNKVDFLGTNPPFTRGERLSPTYKAFLQEFFSRQTSFTGEIKSLFCSKNMPLHGYFLLDMDRFLRPGGRFGVVLPASTLHLAGLRGVRKYLLEQYSLEYVITSEVESFSEDSDLKEIILIGRVREEGAPAEVMTTYVTIFAPLTPQNYTEFATSIEQPVKMNQAGNSIRTRRVKSEEMREGIADWSTFFPPESNVGLEESLWSGGKVGRVRDLECEAIEAFRGFRQDFAKYWAVPNPYWTLKESRPDYITVQNVEDPKIQIIFPASTWHRGLSRPEFYPRPLIEAGDYFILKESQTTDHEVGTAQYLAWLKQQFSNDTPHYEKFLQQFRQIGIKFDFKGRIAFCHRIDVTTSKIICFLCPTAVQLNQNWFSIRGLDPIAEEILVAWFNSTLFIATYMQRRRTQRGPYGQTAVREFREYLVPLLGKLDSEQKIHVIDQFREFNQSREFDFPINEQISRCLYQDTSRKEFDLVVLDAMQVFPSQRQKQRKFLEPIYRYIVENIEKVRLQKKRNAA